MDRLTMILQHLRQAAELAEQEAKEWQATDSMAHAFRKAAHQGPGMDEISRAFNTLTANLLYAGMPLREGNEIAIRLSNAVNAARSLALK